MKNPLREDGSFWVSPGSRVGFAVVACLFALIFAFSVLPARQDRIQRQERQRTEDIQAARSARTGAALLHRFDCTYGEAIRATLMEAARTQRVQAQIALAARRAALGRGDRRAANRSIRSRRSAQTAAAQYTRLAQSLTPLGRSYQGIPVPPCPRR